MSTIAAEVEATRKDRCDRGAVGDPTRSVTGMLLPGRWKTASFCCWCEKCKSLAPALVEHKRLRTKRRWDRRGARSNGERPRPHGVSHAMTTTQGEQVSPRTCGRRQQTAHRNTSAPEPPCGSVPPRKH